MSIEPPSYLNRGCRHMSICDSVEFDTRLQAIADAWNEYTDVIKDEQLGTMEWLSVVALLDALNEENGDE